MATTLRPSSRRTCRRHRGSSRTVCRPPGARLPSPVRGVTSCGAAPRSSMATTNRAQDGHGELEHACEDEGAGQSGQLIRQGPGDRRAGSPAREVRPARRPPERSPTRPRIRARPERRPRTTCAACGCSPRRLRPSRHRREARQGAIRTAGALRSGRDRGAGPVVAVLWKAGGAVPGAVDGQDAAPDKIQQRRGERLSPSGSS